MFRTTLAARVSHCWQLPTEHVEEFKVVWTSKKKLHTVPVERASAHWQHHVSMGLTLQAFFMLCGSYRAVVLWHNPVTS